MVLKLDTKRELYVMLLYDLRCHVAENVEVRVGVVVEVRSSTGCRTSRNLNSMLSGWTRAKPPRSTIAPLQFLYRAHDFTSSNTTIPSTDDTHPKTANMPGVSVRDVPSDKFIAAYAAFLKRQGKLPIPGS